MFLRYKYYVFFRIGQFQYENTVKHCCKAEFLSYGKLSHGLCMKDYPCRRVLHELGGIPLLLELVKSDFPVIQQLVLKTLVNITIDKDTRATFREEQGFEKLMDILNDKVGMCVYVCHDLESTGYTFVLKCSYIVLFLLTADNKSELKVCVLLPVPCLSSYLWQDFSDLHHEALQVVANCLNDSECLHMVLEGGGLTSLMKFVFTPTIPEIQTHAVNCITRVAQSCKQGERQQDDNSVSPFESPNNTYYVCAPTHMYARECS